MWWFANLCQMRLWESMLYWMNHLRRSWWSSIRWERQTRCPDVVSRPSRGAKIKEGPSKASETASMSHLPYKDNSSKEARITPSRMQTLVVPFPDQGLLLLSAPQNCSSHPPPWDISPEACAFIFTQGGSVLQVAIQGAPYRQSCSH